jgi:hypothetical protein
MRKTAAKSSISCLNVSRCIAEAAALLWLYVIANTIQFEHQLLMASAIRQLFIWSEYVKYGCKIR